MAVTLAAAVMLGLLLNGKTLLGVGLVVVVIGIGWRVYEHGYSAGEAKVQAVLDQAQIEAAEARAELLARLNQAGRDIDRIRAESETRIQTAEVQTIVKIRTVTQVIENEPEFSAIARPDPLVRLRNDQAAELNAAAARGADLSARSLRGLPGPGD